MSTILILSPDEIREIPVGENEIVYLGDETSLIRACENNHIEIIKYFIQHKPEFDYLTILKYCIENNKSEIFELVVVHFNFDLSLDKYSLFKKIKDLNIAKAALNRVDDKIPAIKKLILTNVYHHRISILTYLDSFDISGIMKELDEVYDLFDKCFSSARKLEKSEMKDDFQKTKETFYWLIKYEVEISDLKNLYEYRIEDYWNLILDQINSFHPKLERKYKKFLGKNLSDIIINEDVLTLDHAVPEYLTLDKIRKQWRKVPYIENIFNWLYEQDFYTKENSDYFKEDCFFVILQYLIQKDWDKCINFMGKYQLMWDSFDEYSSQHLALTILRHDLEKIKSFHRQVDLTKLFPPLNWFKYMLGYTNKELIQSVQRNPRPTKVKDWLIKLGYKYEFEYISFLSRI